MIFDIERLQEDLQDDSYGAYFSGGYGGALIEAMETEDDSDEDIIMKAKKNGIDLRNYIIE